MYRYYLKAMEFYVQHFRESVLMAKGPIKIVFWLESDSPFEIITDRTFLQLATSLSGRDATVEVIYPDIYGSLFASFHRMVMADGIVMSPSAFSVSAAMLNNKSSLLVTPSRADPIRGLWYNTARFHRISHE